MRRLGSVERFARLATQLVSFSELNDFMIELTPKLGFSYFVLTHYVADPLEAKVANLSSFPERWVATATDRHYWKDSPIALACKRSLAGFPWSELSLRIPLTKRHREILRAAQARGVGEGYSIPANIPKGISGSISFAMEEGKPLPAGAFHATQYLSCFAYEAGQRIARLQRGGTQHLPSNLSTRQLDCVILVARGKSDWEAGQLLGISKETVHKHIQAAMRRLGVTTRTQLVVRALYDSHVSFGDVLD
jgi:LuxR family quorum-sensing system transcriptional regulator CciR